MIDRRLGAKGPREVGLLDRGRGISLERLSQVVVELSRIEQTSERKITRPVLVSAHNKEEGLQ
jgi:hypothetical protein